MKRWLKARLADAGVHAYTSASLPTGVNWLHDIRRLGTIGPAPLCFDVGANVGQTVRELRAAWPGSRIHAFEPFATPYAQLATVCSELGGATAVSMALGAQPGQVEVAPRELSVLNSLLPASPSASAAAACRPRERIRIDTVDAYCHACGIERVDVLKTDTEGYDLEVLHGAEELLGSGRAGFVYVEVTFLAGNTQNSPFQPIFEHLTARHYRFLGLYDTYPLLHFAEPNLFCNALFAHRAMALS